MFLENRSDLMFAARMPTSGGEAENKGTGGPGHPSRDRSRPSRRAAGSACSSDKGEGDLAQLDEHGIMGLTSSPPWCSWTSMHVRRLVQHARQGARGVKTKVVRNCKSCPCQPCSSRLLERRVNPKPRIAARVAVDRERGRPVK